MACLALAGCTHEENEITEQPQEKALTKEQLVGVWRSGGYWVSFSDDWYNSAYFPLENAERIDEGSYTISGDTVTVENSLYYSTTRYIIHSISGDTLRMTQIYNIFNSSRDGEDNYDIYTPLTLTKSNEVPPVKLNGFSGMTFTYRDIPEEESLGSDSITYQNFFDFEEYHQIRFATEVRTKWGIYGGAQYYIYLNPVIYHVTTPDQDYDKGLKVKKAHLTKNNDVLTYRRLQD